MTHAELVTCDFFLTGTRPKLTVRENLFVARKILRGWELSSANLYSTECKQMYAQGKKTVEEAQQAEQYTCSWLIIVYMKRAKSMRVMNGWLHCHAIKNKNHNHSMN